MKNQARHPSKVPSVCCLHGFIKGVRSAHGTRNERHQDKDLGSSLKSPPRLIPNLGRCPNLRSFSQRPVADVPPNREKEMAPPLDVAPSASGEYVAMFHGVDLRRWPVGGRTGPLLSSAAAIPGVRPEAVRTSARNVDFNVQLYVNCFSS